MGAALALAAVTRPLQRYPKNSVETTPNSVWTDRDPLQGSRINFELSRLACLKGRISDSVVILLYLLC